MWLANDNSRVTNLVLQLMNRLLVFIVFRLLFMFGSCKLLFIVKDHFANSQLDGQLRDLFVIRAVLAVS